MCPGALDNDDHIIVVTDTQFEQGGFPYLLQSPGFMNFLEFGAIIQCKETGIHPHTAINDHLETNYLSKILRYSLYSFSKYAIW